MRHRDASATLQHLVQIGQSACTEYGFWICVQTYLGMATTGKNATFSIYCSIFLHLHIKASKPFQRWDRFVSLCLISIYVQFSHFIYVHFSIYIYMCTFHVCIVYIVYFSIYVHFSHIFTLFTA